MCLHILQLGLSIKSSVSYPVKTDVSIMQCATLFTEDFGVVFSLVTEDGNLIAATIQDGMLRHLKSVPCWYYHVPSLL